MKKMFYPAIFHKAEEGGYWISFPDIPECLTEGDNMEQSYNMAVDALGLCISGKIDSGEQLPVPSHPDNIYLEQGSYLIIVEFDMETYKRKHSSRAVKKTLSIPQWLNEEAAAKGINFSAVLQDALKQQLNI